VRAVHLFLCFLAVLLFFAEVRASESMKNLKLIDGLFYSSDGTQIFTGDITDQSAGSIKNGLKTGPWKYFHEDGALARAGGYKHGKRHGLWVGYYENGQIYFEGRFDSGKKVGPWISYYDSGKLFYKGTYENGRKVGEWVSYNPDGSVWDYQTGTFENNVKINE